MATKKRTFEDVVKRLGPRSAPTVKSPARVHIGGIKPVARKIAKSHRIGGARGPSA
jgi:hypothetical protein